MEVPESIPRPSPLVSIIFGFGSTLLPWKNFRLVLCVAFPPGFFLNLPWFWLKSIFEYLGGRTEVFNATRLRADIELISLDARFPLDWFIVVSRSIDSGSIGFGGGRTGYPTWSSSSVIHSLSFMLSSTVFKSAQLLKYHRNTKIRRTLP